MFCMKCGTKLPDNSRFCNVCGASLGDALPAADAAEAANANPVAAPVTNLKAPSAKRNIIILSVVLVLLIVGSFVALFATGAIGGNSSDKILETAEKYLDNEEYEEAIIQFEKLLEIDPLNVDAYLGLAQAYEAQGDIDEAVEVLEKALGELDGDVKGIERIEKALARLVKPEEPVTEEAPPATTTAVTATAATTTAKSTTATTKSSATTKATTVITTTEAATTTAVPVVSEPEVQLFDISTVYGDWCTEYDVVTFNATQNPTNVNISARGISIKADKLDVYFDIDDITFTEDGFCIDNMNNDGYLYTFTYFSDSETLLMSINSDIEDRLRYYYTDFYLERGTIDVSEEGKVLNIWCWTDEFKQRMIKFYPDYVDNGDGTGRIGDVTVRWTINTYEADENEDYLNPLDRALKKQPDFPDDEKIDIFLTEGGYVYEYANGRYTLPVSDFGITTADTADMYEYTKQMATDANGQLKAVTWQACPGAFVYRRSIAKAVLGTDDPAVVQEYVKDWDSFDETAAKMKDSGYYMLSGFDSAYRTFSCNTATPWVNDENEIIVDENNICWVEQAKAYAENGYDAAHKMWSAEWQADQSARGKVFGFFYSTWGIEWTLPGYAGDDGAGDWAVCYGPEAYYWGGTWICAGYQTDNPTLVGDIMYNMTCKADIMEQMMRDNSVRDFANNMTAMKNIADDSSYGSDFLGGQNHVSVLHECAMDIDMSNASVYDEEIYWLFQYAMEECIYGVSVNSALQSFYENTMAQFPELKLP